MNLVLVDSGSGSRLIEVDQPLVAGDDRGLAYGDGLFETIRVMNGRPLFLSRHLSRLMSGLGVLRLTVPWNEDALSAAIQALIETNGVGNGLIRLVISRGRGPRGFDIPTESAPSLIVQSAPQPPAPPPASVIVVPWRTDPASPLLKLKSLSALDKVLAKDYARQAGADEALFQNIQGQLTEGTSSNLFLVQEGRLLTPALSCGLLAGITRSVLLELTASMGGRIIETEVSLEQLLNAQEAFLTNAATGLRPIGTVAGRPVSTSQPGELTTKLAEAYRQYCMEASALQ